MIWNLRFRRLFDVYPCYFITIPSVGSTTLTTNQCLTLSPLLLRLPFLSRKALWQFSKSLASRKDTFFLSSSHAPHTKLSLFFRLYSCCSRIPIQWYPILTHMKPIALCRTGDCSSLVQYVTRFIVRSAIYGSCAWTCNSQVILLFNSRPINKNSRSLPSVYRRKITKRIESLCQKVRIFLSPIRLFLSYIRTIPISAPSFDGFLGQLEILHAMRLWFTLGHLNEKIEIHKAYFSVSPRSGPSAIDGP